MGRPKKQQPEISEKNKKDEILTAYYDLLREKEEEWENQPLKKQEHEKDQASREKASLMSYEGIVHSLTDAKLKIAKFLEELEERMLDEHKKFTELQQAVTSSQKKLKDLYAIEEKAASLSALVEVHEKTKQELEDEIEATRLDWENEQESYQEELRLQKEQQDKDRKRENEEYEYALSQKRKKEQDLYEEQKTQLEKELKNLREQTEEDLQQRETAIAASEQELHKLREEVSSFPAKLEETIHQEHEKTENEIKKQMQFDIQLATSEHEAEKRLLNERIKSLEAKINEQVGRIQELNDKTNAANKQAQDIAIRAIDSTSQSRALRLTGDNPIASTRQHAVSSPD